MVKWIYRPSERSERPRTALLRAFEVCAKDPQNFEKVGLGSRYGPSKQKQSLLFFAFVLEKQEKETLFLAEKNKKHQRNKSLAFFVLLFYKKHQEILSSALLTSWIFLLTKIQFKKVVLMGTAN